MKQSKTALIIALVLLVAAIGGVLVAGCSWFQSGPEPEPVSRFVVQATPAAHTGQRESTCIECYGQSRYIWGSGIAFYTDNADDLTMYLDGANGNIVMDGGIDAEGSLDAAGNVVVAGTLDVTGTTTLDDLAVTSVTGDLTVTADSTGGNAGAKSEIIGLPRIMITALLTGTNGTTETEAWMDDTPDGEWVTTGASVTVITDTTFYRVGTQSLEATFAITATAGDGISGTVTSDDLTDSESIGFWAYPTTEVISGDLEIQFTDDDAATPPTATVAVTLTASTWQWVEVDISSCDGGGTDCDAVTEVVLQLTTQGATNLGAFTLYLDGVYKWDSSDEEALGQAIQQDGVLAVLSVLIAQGEVNTLNTLTEYTDYFVHYEDGNDFLVWISDQSARSNVALIAY